MVVDDEPFVRLSIASMANWAEEGFDFRFEASDGEEALALLGREREIDIVLLDLSMPNMDGIAMLRELRSGETERSDAAAQSPAVVVLSAHDDFHLVREAFKLGAGDYLLKSELDEQKLRAALEKAAEGLAESRERTRSMLQRRHIESLKSNILRECLEKAPSEGIAESFEALGSSLRAPFVLVGLWVEDFEAIAERWGEEGIGRFSDMLVRTLSQLAAGVGGGEVLSLKPSHALVFLSAPEPADKAAERSAAFCEDAREYVERYLSVRVSCAASPPCAGLGGAAAAYRALGAGRSIESRIVVQAKRVIRERFADSSFSLEEAGSKVGVSRNHLSFEFSRETGETFTAYLCRTRIEEAKRLLAQTELKVYEVGERVGYPNVEHFSRTFKRIVGVSPARYKSRDLDGDEGPSS
jgi:two-component system response regulator YesN